MIIPQESCFTELKHLILETGRELFPGKHFKGVNEIIPLQVGGKYYTVYRSKIDLKSTTKFRSSLFTKNERKIGD